jgi:hypothetical protein
MPLHIQSRPPIFHVKFLSRLGSWASPFTLFIGGLVPLGACFIELYFILDYVWMYDYCYAFGFLMLVFFITTITCAEITLLFHYCQICYEDYHWWWRSFGTSGSIAISVFLYSFVYLKNLKANSLTTNVLYFGYMALACFGLFSHDRIHKVSRRVVGSTRQSSEHSRFMDHQQYFPTGEYFVRYILHQKSI